MSIEKLAKVAAAHVQPRFKAKWLQWWNSTLMVRHGNKFPSLPLKERTLEAWLHKASFWAQVSILLFLFLFLFIVSFLFLIYYFFVFVVGGPG